jgi:hypothetical protein
VKIRRMSPPRIAEIYLDRQSEGFHSADCAAPAPLSVLICRHRGKHTPLTAASTLTKSKVHTTKNRTEVLCPRVAQAAMIAAASFGLRRSGRFATATSGAAYGPHQ